MELAIVPETKEVDQRAAEALSIAADIAIRDASTYQTACDFLKSLKTIEKDINATFDEPIHRAFEAHRAIVAAKKKHFEPIERAESIVKPKIAAYLQEQERIRRDEERRLQEEARKKAEEEALAQAAELEAEGDKEAAEALISEPVQVAPVVLPKTTPKVSGIASREVWLYRIVDAGKIPRQYLKIDEQKIGQVVRAMKGSADIPGVQVYPEKHISAGRI